MPWNKNRLEHCNPSPDGYPVAPRRSLVKPSPPAQPQPDKLRYCADQPLDAIFGGSLLAWTNKSPQEVVSVIEALVDEDGRRAIPRPLLEAWECENHTDLAPYFAASELRDPRFGRFPTRYRADPDCTSRTPCTQAEKAEIEERRRGYYGEDDELW